MDRAFDYGSKGWGFESLRDRKSFLFLLIFTYAYEDIWVACIITIYNSISFDIFFFGVFYHYKQNKILKNIEWNDFKMIKVTKFFYIAFFAKRKNQYNI